MLAWIEAILGEKLPAGSFEDVLRDGTILCKLIGKLLPGSVPKINTSGGQFKFMENINHFQTACRRYGVPDVDVFQTVDLYERRNIPAVTQCIMALGRTCYLHPEFKGPFLGPKVSGAESLVLEEVERAVVESALARPLEVAESCPSSTLQPAELLTNPAPRLWIDVVRSERIGLRVRASCRSHQ